MYLKPLKEALGDRCSMLSFSSRLLTWSKSSKRSSGMLFSRLALRSSASRLFSRPRNAFKARKYNIG